MKKIYIFFLFLLLPSSSFAELDVFLSTSNAPYSSDIWTSENYPNSGSDSLSIDHSFNPEEYPSSYGLSSSDVLSLVRGLFPSDTSARQELYYDNLVSIDQQGFSTYLGIAISPSTDTYIDDKIAAGFVLSSFESTFQSCVMSLGERENVVRDLLLDIDSGAITDIESLEYSDIRFGDCIVPFPDVRRGNLVIMDSFPSNKARADALSGSPLSFGSIEDSVEMFSLASISLGGSYVGVQANNILDLSSTRVEQDTDFDKTPGQQRILYIHQNSHKNIYKDVLISGDNSSGYTIGGSAFNASHSLVTRSSDSETERTYSQWQQVTSGIYSKTLIQEDTFDIVSGIYIPKQSVGVSTYYAVVYNYDITPPYCQDALFSHESAGNENFIFPSNRWFSSSKYGYFTCSDDESGCFCDSSVSGCFLRDDSIFSIPQEIEHGEVFSYGFLNSAGLPEVCSSRVDEILFYDVTAPDVSLDLGGVPESTLAREYVSNGGILYNGIDIPGKNYYHIQNNLSFQADEDLDMILELYDPYDSSDISQGVSGLSSYNLKISKYNGSIWTELIQDDTTFPEYNTLGNVVTDDTHIINLQTLTGIRDVFTKVGRYQVYIKLDDGAGNQSRVIFYFDIVAGDIDPANSILDTLHRDDVYADNVNGYEYSVLLRDKYFNSISDIVVSGVDHSCFSLSPCHELRVDMRGVVANGNSALEIYDIDTVSHIDGRVNFSVKSKIPGIFSESFSLNLGIPAVTHEFIASENTFLSPLTGVLEVNVGGSWVGDELPINQESDYRLRVIDSQGVGYAWNISDFSSHLSGRHIDTSFVLSTPITTGVDGEYFSGNFVSTLSSGEEHKVLLEVVESATSGVIISYILGGETVAYRLFTDELLTEHIELGNTGELENPVKIIGALQGVGNTHNSQERQNITNTNTQEFRNTIRKNVGENLGSLIDGDTLGGVKYIDKTGSFNKEYILESNPGFETLVVRNGNVHITNDFNASGDVVGIISYIDTGYNKETGYDDIGNIYIEPSVSSIKASLYADGGIISTSSSIPISGNIAYRNNNLGNQLWINGSVFTRNTLAGGRELSGEYMLPGGEITTDRDLAVLYDLYYTRRGNTGCDIDGYGFCNTQEYLVVEYDPRINSNPPIYFDAR